MKVTDNRDKSVTIKELSIGDAFQLREDCYFYIKASNDFLDGTVKSSCLRVDSYGDCIVIDLSSGEMVTKLNAELVIHS